MILLELISVITVFFSLGVHGACDTLWYESGDHCYYVGMKNFSISWNESEYECLKMSGHLASIESTSEYDVILGYLMLYSFTVNEYAWIGLNDIAVESQWIWSDGTTYNSSVSRWQFGQPDNGFICVSQPCGQDCVALVSGCGIKWDDRECSGRFYVGGSRSFFICKKLAITTTGQRESMGTGDLTNAACDPLWYESGDHCYYVGMKTSNITWSYSENECLNMGGHLASIESTSEFNVISGYLMLSSFSMNDYAWIGLNDIAVELQWVWSDGITYNSSVSRWQFAQPDNGWCGYWCTGNQDCVAIVSDTCQMKWDDRECSGSFYIEGSRSFFVCKKGLSPTTQSTTSTEVITTVTVKTTGQTETTTLDSVGINNAPNETTSGWSTMPIGRVTTSEETTLRIENGSAGAAISTSTATTLIQATATGTIVSTTEMRSNESTLVESSTSTSLHLSSFTEPQPTIDTKCFCRCSSLLRKGNMTRQELADFVRLLNEELTVNKSTLSSNRRQLTSAPDERPSSIAIGSTFAIFVICCVFCPIVIVDILRCIKRIWN